MNRILRNAYTMITLGTVAGYFSGSDWPAYFGVRGAVFGCMLTLTVLWIRREGWSWHAFLMGPALSLLLLSYDQFAPVEETAPAVNTMMVAIFAIPAYAYAYGHSNIALRLPLLLTAGVVSTALRIGGINRGIFLDYYARGTVIFLILWLLAMGLTDPRFIHWTRFKRKTKVAV
ncbi:MAG: hypothetical protein JXR25_01640 [Pontiellaceae bacterium]|nr:hypothetical protein [Pontiellaceae bacterium]MBN2783502.1 hypothetical protein [Pontiellaceae bacterium]